MAALALAGYAWLLASHFGPAAAGADCSGYFNHARQIAVGETSTASRLLGDWGGQGRLPDGLVPLGFAPSVDGRDLVPTYPPGLPLMLAGAERLFGWDGGAAIVMIGHACAAAILVWLLAGDMGLSRWAGGAATACVALSPLTLSFSTVMMSDVPALAWTTGAVLAGWRSRGKGNWAFAAGALVGMAVLIRPSNVLAALPVGLCLGRSFGRWVRLGLGGMPFLAGWLLYNHRLYGSWATTGYGPGPFGLFDWHWAAPTALHYLRWFPLLLSPAVMLAPLFGLTAGDRRRFAVLGAWFLGFAGFYAFYGCTRETWWYLRFLLPASPALAIAGIGAAEALGRRLGWSAAGRGWVCAIGLIGGFALFQSERLSALELGADLEQSRQFADWINANLPRNAVLLAGEFSGAAFYYTPFTVVRWESCDTAERERILRELRRSHRPLFAALFSSEVASALKRRFPGQWSAVAKLEPNREVWRLDGGAPDAPSATWPAYRSLPEAFGWNLSLPPDGAGRFAMGVCNAGGLILLCRLSVRLIPGKHLQGRLCRAGIWAAAALEGIREWDNPAVAATALIALAVAGAERGRGASSLLGLCAATLGQAGSAVGLPAIAGAPLASIGNLAKWLLFCAAGALVWSLCPELNGAPLLTWGQHACYSGAALWQCLKNIGAGGGPIADWALVLTLAGLAVQIAWMIRSWAISDPWWRLGAAGALLLVPAWDSIVFCGDAHCVRVLMLPLTLGFGVLAGRSRPPLPALVGGNLGLAGALIAVGLPLGSFARGTGLPILDRVRISGSSGEWFAAEQSAKHVWAWSRGSARLDVRASDPALGRIAADLTLTSPVARTVHVRAGGREIWRGAVGREPCHARFAIPLEGGDGRIELTTDTPAQADRLPGDARQLGFAVFDPKFSRGS